ncbi:Hypothetical predicted protein [Scomber scombrus]|uniref:Uncharacterized protein n=1 Tax=Scomber scombrus TaxID=13677 RepID=A0AAV1N4J0_SCOSC
MMKRFEAQSEHTEHDVVKTGIYGCQEVVGTDGGATLRLKGKLAAASGCPVSLPESATFVSFRPIIPQDDRESHSLAGSSSGCSLLHQLGIHGCQCCRLIHCTVQFP